MSHLRSWWYRHSRFNNFGDELGSKFLTLLGHEVERVPIGEADILTTGSILHRLTKESPKDGLIVWGTGWHKTPLRTIRGLDVRAVRGTVTAKALNTGGITLGDPGLLASHFWPAYATVKGRVGWVPNYIDDRPLDNTHYIDVRADPETVCAEISTCESVIASSLHGCIVAASYRIPFMRLAHPLVVGGDTKWIDFTTSLNAPIETIQQRLLERIADL